MMYEYGWWAPMGFIFIVFMVSFVAVGAWLITGGVRPKSTGGNEFRALAELADRYARGEIDGEEYRTRRSIIEGSI